MANDVIYNILVPIVIAILASSSFWAILERKAQRHSNQTELLIGLAHDRIVYLCMKYLKRGFITHEEYENLVKYLYKPYQKIGGNGSALRLMEEVNKLPIKQSHLLDDLEKEK